jgi:hypothetical protein
VAVVGYQCTMASRNLTALFLELRGKSRRSNQSFSASGIGGAGFSATDNGSQRLLHHPQSPSDDVELSIVKLPPVWVDLVEGIKIDLQRIQLECKFIAFLVHF